MAIAFVRYANPLNLNFQQKELFFCRIFRTKSEQTHQYRDILKLELVQERMGQIYQGQE